MPNCNASGCPQVGQELFLSTNSNGISGENSVTHLGNSSPTRIRGARLLGSCMRVSGRCLKQDQCLSELDAHWSVQPPFGHHPQFAEDVFSLCERQLCPSHNPVDQNIPTTHREIVDPADQLVLRVVPSPWWSVQVRSMKNPTTFVSTRLCMSGFLHGDAHGVPEHTTQEMGHRFHQHSPSRKHEKRP